MSDLRRRCAAMDLAQAWREVDVVGRRAGRQGNVALMMDVARAERDLMLRDEEVQRSRPFPLAALRALTAAWAGPQPPLPRDELTRECVTCGRGEPCGLRACTLRG